MLTNFELSILNAIQALRFPLLDWLMIFITYVGSTAIIWILPAIVLTIKKETRPHGLALAAAMLSVQLVGTLALKNLIARPRPFALPEALLSAETLPISVPMGEYSFPSGHAATAFAAATSIWFYNKKLGAAAFAVAALIGLSRVYLYVHFPTDVLGGAALGLLCAAVMRLLREKIEKNNRTDT